jgi:hypothetical protein
LRERVDDFGGFVDGDTAVRKIGRSTTSWLQLLQRRSTVHEICERELRRRRRTLRIQVDHECGPRRDGETEGGDRVQERIGR